MMLVIEALNYQWASDDRDGSRAWQAIDALGNEVRRLRQVIEGWEALGAEVADHMEYCNFDTREEQPYIRRLRGHPEEADE